MNVDQLSRPNVHKIILFLLNEKKQKPNEEWWFRISQDYTQAHTDSDHSDIIVYGFTTFTNRVARQFAPESKVLVPIYTHPHLIIVRVRESGRCYVIIAFRQFANVTELSAKLHS